jgi:hypothetical protein
VRAGPQDVQECGVRLPAHLLSDDAASRDRARSSSQPGCVFELAISPMLSLLAETEVAEVTANRGETEKRRTNGHAHAGDTLRAEWIERRHIRSHERFGGL